MNNTQALSTELQLLIETCKVSLLEQDDNRLCSLLKNTNINWQRMKNLSAFHKISPVLYDSFRKTNHQNPLSSNLQQIALGQTVANMSTNIELAKILSHLQKENIRILPYKGLIFLKEFYQDKPLREISDLDLVIHPDDAKKALLYLVKNGYKMYHRSPKEWISLAHQIDDTLAAHGLHEITLEKKLDNGFNISIDFHWGFIYSFLPYNLDINVFFKETKSTKINHTICQTPSDKILLMMLILHHGGRDCWVNFKLLADLMMFYKSQKEDYDWQAAIDFAENLKLKKALLTGFCLLEKYFDIALNNVLKENITKENITNKQLNRIQDFWEKHQLFNTLFPRLRYERILINLQDKGFSAIKYYRNAIMMYGYPNPLENKRIITFPANYVYMNALSKILTYLVTKFKKQA